MQQDRGRLESWIGIPDTLWWRIRSPKEPANGPDGGDDADASADLCSAPKIEFEPAPEPSPDLGSEPDGATGAVAGDEKVAAAGVDRDREGGKGENRLESAEKALLLPLELFLASGISFSLPLFLLLHWCASILSDDCLVSRGSSPRRRLSNWCSRDMSLDVSVLFVLLSVDGCMCGGGAMGVDMSAVEDGWEGGGWQRMLTMHNTHTHIHTRHANGD